MRKRREVRKSTDPRRPNWRRFVWPLFILLTLGIAAYWNSFGVPFVFDDLASITTNSAVQFGNSLFHWFTLPRGILLATFAANRAINGDSVWGYHFVNLVLHLLNGCLIYFFGLRIFNSPSNSGEMNPETAALLAASFFLVHPVQTESVTYISSRSELLSTFFYVLAVFLFAHTSPDRIGFTFGLPIGILFVLGMRTKETVISLPAALLLYDFIFLSGGQIRRVFARWRFYLTLLVGGVAAAVYVLINLQHSVGAVAPGNLSSHDYFLTQLRVAVQYVQMTFLPVNLNLAHDVRPSTTIFEPAVIACGLFLLATAFFGWRERKRNPVVAFSIFWFFITLAPTSSFVSVLDVIFDHRLYLPLVGVCFCFPVILISIKRVLLSKTSFVLTPLRSGAVIVFVLVSATVMRNQVWADDITLWSDTIAKSPAKARGYSGLAQAYFSRGDYEKAIEVSKQGIQNTRGGNAPFYGNIGQFYLLLGRYDEALDAFAKVLQTQATPAELARAYYNIAVTYMYKQQLQPAADALVKTLELDSSYLPAWDSYIDVSVQTGKQQPLRDELDQLSKRNAAARANYGFAKLALTENKYKDAVEFFKQAWPAYTNEKIFLSNYAVALENAGDTSGAIDRYLDALRIDPQFMQAHFNLAQVYFEIHQFASAIPHFEQAIKADPRNAAAHIQLARIFIQQGQRALARNHLSAVLNMSPGNSEAAALWSQTL